MTINQFADYTSKTYNYSNRLGNLTAEAVGVIKGEKHFPVFAGSDHIQASYKIKAIIHTSVCLCGSVLVVGDQHVFYASTAVSAGFL